MSKIDTLRRRLANWLLTEQPNTVEDDGLVLTLSDGDRVKLRLAGGSCVGKVDDGCIGFTDEHGNHQTLLIQDHQ